MTSNKLLYYIVIYFIPIIKLQEIPEYDENKNYDDDIFDPLQDLQNIKYMAEGKRMTICGVVNKVSI